MFAQSETDIPMRWGEQYQAVSIVLKSQGASAEDLRLSKSLIIQACQSDGSVYGSGPCHAISTVSCTISLRLKGASGLLWSKKMRAMFHPLLLLCGAIPIYLC